MNLCRKQAIRLLWSKAANLGIDSEELHSKLRVMSGMRQIRFDSIRKLSGYEISKVLKAVFKVRVFVSDEPIILYIRNICRNHKDINEHLNSLIRHYKAESIYQLSLNQLRFIAGFLKGKIAEKQEKVN